MSISVFAILGFSVYFLNNKSNNSNSVISNSISISNSASSQTNSSQQQVKNSELSTSSQTSNQISSQIINQFSSQTNSFQKIESPTNPKPIQNIPQNTQKAPIYAAFSLPKDAIEIPIEAPKKSTTETVDEKCARITNNSNLSDDASPYYECMRQNGAEVIPM